MLCYEKIYDIASQLHEAVRLYWSDTSKIKFARQLSAQIRQYKIPSQPVQ